MAEDLKRIWGQQKEVLRLSASGLYNTLEIAEIVNLSRSAVSRILNCTLGKQTLDMLQGAADAETMNLMVNIKSLAPIALAIQSEMMMDEERPDKLRVHLTDKILDRAGYSPINKNLNLNMNAGLTKDELDEIKVRARELKTLNQEIEIKNEELADHSSIAVNE